MTAGSAKVPPTIHPSLPVRQTIGYLERGDYSPSLFLALKIAEYFEVPAEVIFSTEPFARLGSEVQTG
ncbi:MAG TPA: helix-turn-helix domain-containing protein [Acidimicrobiia bacterium]|nr:helix-turn-helix domain-containing protein [Acidimicrobiia bacterium]